MLHNLIKEKHAMCKYPHTNQWYINKQKPLINIIIQSIMIIVQELCESGGGRPGLSVLASLLVSVDVKLY